MLVGREAPEGATLMRRLHPWVTPAALVFSLCVLILDPGSHWMEPEIGETTGEMGPLIDPDG